MHFHRESSIPALSYSSNGALVRKASSKIATINLASSLDLAVVRTKIYSTKDAYEEHHVTI